MALVEQVIQGLGETGEVEKLVEKLSPVEVEKLSAVEVERLRSLLPEGWVEHGGLTQLEVILETIEYIKTLQGKLQK